MPDLSKAHQSKTAAIQADVKSAVGEVYLRSWKKLNGKPKHIKLTRIDISPTTIYIQMREPGSKETGVAFTLRLPLTAIGFLISAMARSYGLKGFVTVDVDS